MPRLSDPPLIPLGSLRGSQCDHPARQQPHEAIPAKFHPTGLSLYRSRNQCRAGASARPIQFRRNREVPVSPRRLEHAELRPSQLHFSGPGLRGADSAHNLPLMGVRTKVDRKPRCLERNASICSASSAAASTARSSQPKQPRSPPARNFSAPTSFATSAASRPQKTTSAKPSAAISSFQASIASASMAMSLAISTGTRPSARVLAVVPCRMSIQTRRQLPTHADFRHSLAGYRQRTVGRNAVDRNGPDGEGISAARDDCGTRTLAERTIIAAPVNGPQAGKSPVENQQISGRAAHAPQVLTPLERSIMCQWCRRVLDIGKHSTLSPGRNRAPSQGACTRCTRLPCCSRLQLFCSDRTARLQVLREFRHRPHVDLGLVHEARGAGIGQRHGVDGVVPASARSNRTRPRRQGRGRAVRCRESARRARGGSARPRGSGPPRRTGRARRTRDRADRDQAHGRAISVHRMRRSPEQHCDRLTFSERCLAGANEVRRAKKAPASSRSPFGSDRVKARRNFGFVLLRPVVVADICDEPRPIVEEMR